MALTVKPRRAVDLVPGQLTRCRDGKPLQFWIPVIPRPDMRMDRDGGQLVGWRGIIRTPKLFLRLCPYGCPGETIYLREGFRIVCGEPWYQADEHPAEATHSTGWRPARQMSAKSARWGVVVESVGMYPLSEATPPDADAAGFDFKEQLFVHVRQVASRTVVAGEDPRCWVVRGTPVPLREFPT